ncbi:hypothetical protein ACQP06_34690 [Nocardia sp. CA-136227]|uniref:hypothetical protein n=1 Tax=Nocardia sp. CA-136227 TaxID=3239979 RepID=UPI003D96DE87
MNPPNEPRRPQPPGPGGPTDGFGPAGPEGPTLPSSGRQAPPPPPPGPPVGGPRPGPGDPAAATVHLGGRQAPPPRIPPQAPVNAGPPPRSGGPVGMPQDSRQPAPAGPRGPQQPPRNPAAGQVPPPGPGSLVVGSPVDADDRTVPAPLPRAETAAPAQTAAPDERKPLHRKDIALSLGLYLLGVVAAFGFGYDLFAKLFDLVHNRCTAKRDFSVQCIVIRPPASALWGLLIGGGGMFLALVGAMVLASVAAMTGRRAWIWTAVALPVILVAGGAGHVLVATAIS